MAKTIVIAILIGLGIIGILMGLIHLIGGGPEWRVSPIDPNIVAVMPSTVRMADLCAGVGSWLLIVIGGLLSGFGISAGINDTALTSNHRSDTGLRIALTLAGLFLILTVYFIPSYTRRDFIHITTTREEARAITNKAFTDKNMKDPNTDLYLKYFRNQ